MAVEVYELTITLVSVAGHLMPLTSGSAVVELFDDPVPLVHRDGKGTVFVVSGRDFVISASSAATYPVTVTARLGPGGTALTDDAFSTLTWDSSGTAAELRITVGQLADAAEDPVSDEELRRSASVDGVVPAGKPAGVLVDRSSPPQSFAHWRHLSMPDHAGEPTTDGSTNRFAYQGDQVAGDPVKTGLDRFNITGAKVFPFAAGRLRWLTYGPDAPSGYASGRQYIVAVWTPLTPDSFTRSASATGDLPVDLVAYFSPNADRGSFLKVRDTFGAVLEGGKILQPYVDLAYRHLLSNQGIVPQLLAAGRRPVVVMPINTRGSWGPFDSPEGWWRFLAELMLHLTRTTAANTAFMPIPPRRAVLGRLVVAGFSVGGAIAASMLAASSPLTKGLPAANFGLPGGGPAMVGATTEIWDFDSSFVGMPPWTVRRAAYAQWFQAKPGRILRIYHTVSTVGNWRPDAKTETQQAFRRLLSSVATPRPRANTPQGEWVEQWDDRSKRWTIVLTSDSGDTTDTAGYIGGPRGLAHTDAKTGMAGHELVAHIMVGHAALLSDLPRTR